MRRRDVDAETEPLSGAPSFALLLPLVQPWGVARLLGLCRVLPYHHSLKGVEEL